MTGVLDAPVVHVHHTASFAGMQFVRGGGACYVKLRARRHGVGGARCQRRAIYIFTTLQDSLSDNAGFVLTPLLANTPYKGKHILYKRSLSTQVLSYPGVPVKTMAYKREAVPGESLTLPRYFS